MEVGPRHVLAWPMNGIRCYPDRAVRVCDHSMGSSALKGVRKVLCVHVAMLVDRKELPSTEVCTALAWTTIEPSRGLGIHAGDLSCRSMFAQSTDRRYQPRQTTSSSPSVLELLEKNRISQYNPPQGLAAPAPFQMQLRPKGAPPSVTLTLISQPSYSGTYW